MGSSFNDVVKYGATLYMERNTKGHNKAFIGIVVLGAIVLLAFQILLVVSLNEKNESLLFCGDVITKIDQYPNDNKYMFMADSVYDFNRTWHAKATIKENQYLSRIEKSISKGSRRMLNDGAPGAGGGGLGGGDPTGGGQDVPGVNGGSESGEPSEPYYSDYDNPYNEEEDQENEKEYARYMSQEKQGGGDHQMPQERSFKYNDLTIEQVTAVQTGLQSLFSAAQMEHVNDLASKWKTSEIKNQSCKASESSYQNEEDLSRVVVLLKELKVAMDKATDKSNVTFQNVQFDQQTVKLLEKDLKNRTWTCPKMWRNSKGKCNYKWSCSIKGWQTYCKGQMSFASTIPSANKPAWLAGVTILGISVTADIYDHLQVMRQVPLFFKLLLILQCMIAINIATLNASLTAGQSTPVDILMNSMGLLVINDMDNIFGSIFLMIRTKAEEDDDLLSDGVEPLDQMFARWLAYPHLIQVVFYTLWFTNVFQFDHPETGLTTIVYFLPYSLCVFPAIIIIWYMVCYLDKCQKIRCKFCFGPKNDSEELMDTKKVGDMESELKKMSVNGTSEDKEVKQDEASIEVGILQKQEEEE